MSWVLSMSSVSPLRVAAVSTLVAGVASGFALLTVGLWARCLDAIDLFAVVAAAVS